MLDGVIFHLLLYERVLDNDFLYQFNMRSEGWNFHDDSTFWKIKASQNLDLAWKSLFKKPD